MIREMIKFSVALGRRLVWPYISCKAGFVNEERNARLGKDKISIN